MLMSYNISSPTAYTFIVSIWCPLYKKVLVEVIQGIKLEGAIDCELPS